MNVIVIDSVIIIIFLNLCVRFRRKRQKCFKELLSIEKIFILQGDFPTFNIDIKKEGV